jgi:DNA anti-recombination protein RmuC
MYATNDRVAEELSNYCTDLREQLRDSKSTITWLSEQKVLTDQSLREKVALLESSWARVNELEDQLKDLLKANATMEDEIAHLTAISSGDEG